MPASVNYRGGRQARPSPSGRHQPDNFLPHLRPAFGSTFMNGKAERQEL
jgi:hypothetical protein